jgi:hypothetical protein
MSTFSFRKFAENITPYCPQTYSACKLMSQYYIIVTSQLTTFTLKLFLIAVKLLRRLLLKFFVALFLLRNVLNRKIVSSIKMKLKVYNKKVINFVWKNMMTSFFVADRAKKLGHHIFPYKVYNL